MKPIEVPAFDDERIMVPFSVKVPSRKTPLVFKLPRRDFTPYEDVKLLKWLVVELYYDESKLSALVDPDDPRAKDKAAHLLAFRPYLTDAQFKALRTLSFGQLKFISEQLNNQSSITVGEFLASTNSSTGSTGRPSKQTSSTADTEDETSDTD